MQSFFYFKLQQTLMIVWRWSKIGYSDLSNVTYLSRLMIFTFSFVVLMVKLKFIDFLNV